MQIETERLILRPWQESDAQSLFEYASNPLVGPIAGWPVHTSIENSREIIKNVLAVDETYAICMKDKNSAGCSTSDFAVGSISLIFPQNSHTTLEDGEFELGYWLGVPFWGKGYMNEAIKALLHHAFCDLNASSIWCGFYQSNERSKKCMERCGFKYHHTEENKLCPLIGDVRTEIFYKLEKSDTGNR
ncbi:MAG: GNAT family N-acetyltransferase [Treponemataceae bacterium]|nr:GNAT family N-acetyltransferase [Spirochaetales bacterium]MDY6031618.1 GNAT family N-acetyltransferase [Treponemataceae bacterium]